MVHHRVWAIRQKGKDIWCWNYFSKGEAEHSLSKDSTTEYDVEKIMNHPFRTDIIQDTYYVIDSFEQLSDSFDKIDALLFN